jgi:hypothetical protein
MPTLPLSSLDSRTLARRLGELAGDERRVQVEFLLHLDEFDRRRAFLELGHGSLWTYCLEALHLREASAGRRIGAMRVLRRFPWVAEALRDGRLCLTTLAQLRPVLTAENAEDLLARAAFRTNAEVDHLVASLRPRPAPREGLRLLASRAERAASLLPEDASPSQVTQGEASPSAEAAPRPPAPPPALPQAPPQALRSRKSEMRAVSEGKWSLRVTVDKSLRDDLETLAALLSHKVRRGDLAAVLHEAVRCGIEKHGKRKGAVRPARKVAPKTPKDPATVTAELRRQVWERDQGRCAWVGPDGKRCDSRWQVEVDHLDPVGRGGTARLDRLRLACRLHNLLHAEEVYGREHMKKYRKGESTTAGGSSPDVPLAREALAAG